VLSEGMTAMAAGLCSASSSGEGKGEASQKASGQAAGASAAAVTAAAGDLAGDAAGDAADDGVSGMGVRFKPRPGDALLFLSTATDDGVEGHGSHSIVPCSPPSWRSVPCRSPYSDHCPDPYSHSSAMQITPWRSLPRPLLT
jgi:hypothetical protein